MCSHNCYTSRSRYEPHRKPALYTNVSLLTRLYYSYCDFALNSVGSREAFRSATLDVSNSGNFQLTYLIPTSQSSQQTTGFHLSRYRARIEDGRTRVRSAFSTLARPPTELRLFPAGNSRNCR
jgi:hypothetical protein